MRTRVGSWEVCVRTATTAILATTIISVTLGGCAAPPRDEIPAAATAQIQDIQWCDAVRAARIDAGVISDLDGEIDAQLDRVRAVAPSVSEPGRRATSELERLGWLFVAQARRTHDSSLYTLAAYSARCMQQIGGDDGGALLLEGHALYSAHRFREAAAIAHRLVTMRTAPFDYGLLGDTLLTQGEITRAAAAYQRMVDLKPNLQSYARAAQIRWLTGDLDGAREFMTMAARAGSERDSETLAWALSELARFELTGADLDVARATADQALTVYPDHAASLLTLGRIELAADRPEQAVDALRVAVQVSSTPEALWLLAEAHRANGDAAAADAAETRMLAKGPLEDPLTTALFLATRQARPELALSLAGREMAVRSDPHTLDAYGWALAANGDIEGAEQHLRQALAHGTIDARLFLHAGIVAAAAGHHADAEAWLALAARHRTGLLPSEQQWLNKDAGLSVSIRQIPDVPATYPATHPATHIEETT